MRDEATVLPGSDSLIPRIANRKREGRFVQTTRVERRLRERSGATDAQGPPRGPEAPRPDRQGSRTILAPAARHESRAPGRSGGDRRRGRGRGSGGPGRRERPSDPLLGRPGPRPPLPCSGGVLGAFLAFRPRRAGGPPRGARHPDADHAVDRRRAGDADRRRQPRARVRIAGAASLVRYRAKIDDPKDASVMLACLAVGLAPDVGLLDLADAARSSSSSFSGSSSRRALAAEALRAQGLGEGPGGAQGGGRGSPDPAQDQVRAAESTEKHIATRRTCRREGGPTISEAISALHGAVAVNVVWEEKKTAEVSLIVEPDDGIGPMLSAINSAKTSIDIGSSASTGRPGQGAPGRGRARRPVRTLIAHTNRGGEKRLRKLEQVL